MQNSRREGFASAKAPRLQAALALAARGLRVFPLKENAHTPPLIKDFPTLATTDAAQIRRWWRERPNANPAIATDGMLVVDIDPAKGGVETLQALSALNDDLPPTLTVSTARNGVHLYYAATTEVATSTERLGPGLDVRGHHGYVAAPGAIRPEGGYAIVSDAPIAQAPQWLIDLAGQPVERGPVTQAIEELDSDQATKRGIDWLRNAAPLAIEGASGDATTYQVAARLLDFGLSPDGAFEAMAEHWNERCSPPWSPEELERKIDNAARYRQEPIGSRDPQADFDAVEPAGEAGPAAPAKRFRFAAVDDLKPTRADWLVEGWLERRSTALIFGPPNAGKSWLAIHLAARVARGAQFFGQPTQRGRVLYVAAEDPHGVQRRFTAERLSGGSIPDCFVISDPVNLKDAATVRAFLNAVQTEAALKGDLALIVVDTLAMAAAGMDENAGADMNAVLQACKSLGDSTGACVVLLHHQGKDVTKGARGHSSLSAFANSIFHITEGKGGRTQVECTKQKSGPRGEKAYFELRPFPIEIDGGGTESQAVVVPIDRAGAQAAEDFGDEGAALTKQARCALRILETLCANEPFGVDVDRWREAMAAEGIGGRGGGVRQAFGRASKALVTGGYVAHDVTNGFVTPTGKCHSASRHALSRSPDAGPQENAENNQT